MVKYYSYDIFDTCLVRACGSPLAVFDILAQRVLGRDTETTSLMDFALERKEGEVRARMKYVNDGHEDVTIEEIYSCCNFSLFTTMDNTSIMQEEMNIEKEVLLSVKSIKEEIREKRKAGYGIIFTSDMYLPFDFVKGVIEEQGLFENEDRLYLSSKIGKTKSSGNLFKYILDDLKIDPREVFHCGDNLRDDVKIPKGLGIGTKHIVHDMTDYEKVLCNKQYGSQQMDVKIQASISSAIRLNLGESSELLMASDFIATCFVPFVYGILEKTRKKNIDKLFFFARDAYIFYLIAQQFKPVFPEIELKYLYVSRSSLYLPGLKEINYEGISKMFWNFPHVSAEEILERLHLEGLNADKYKTSSDASDILNSMLKDKEFVNTLTRKRDEQREVTRKYFAQEGLTTGNNAIVDLSGTRRCQIAVNNILKESGYNEVYAFYYIVMNIREKGKDYESLNYDERYDRNRQNVSLYPQEIFEQYFCITDQCRTNSYELKNDVVVPVFEEDANTDDYKKKVFKVNEKVCLKYARLYAVMLGNAYHSVLAQIASSVYSYFYFVPKMEYIKAFEGLSFSDSKVKTNALLKREPFWTSVRDYSQQWRLANFMYNCPYPDILYKLYEYDYKKFLHSGQYQSTIDRVNLKIEKFKGKLRNIVYFYWLRKLIAKK